MLDFDAAMLVDDSVGCYRYRLRVAVDGTQARSLSGG